ncbi:MAG: hypothetical protein A2X83_05360 [Desulfuromonadales bacterium GWD2_54_10]|nr:MAG: hypothetical protein A2X83_05360 [Desulfuromonadales bacterium GWD2_54_10]
MIQNKRGFTLVEMLVTMAVFIVVIAISGDAFNSILKHTSKLFRSEESNIEGIVGLEVLRHDLQQAGFGLFTEPWTSEYQEAAALPASAYNDSTDNVPRPFVAGNNIAAVTDTSGDSGAKFDVLADTDYLAIKATTVGRNRVSQKWTYLKYSSNDVYPNSWLSAAENFATNDRVILLRRQIGSTGQSTTIVSDTGGDFYYAYSNTAFSHLTSSGASVYSVYGVDSSPTTPRMPFNRSDYFVARPQDTTSVPSVCAPNSGILYKTTVNLVDGKLNYIPVLDCVADMQIVLGWDMDGNGAVETYSNADGTLFNTPLALASNAVTNTLSNSNNNTAATTPNIRNSLKIVKVYILAQQGRLDPGYTSPSPILTGDVGESSLTRSVNISANGWLNYRWKLYRIIIRPKNLPANQ